MGGRGKSGARLIDTHDIYYPGALVDNLVVARMLSWSITFRMEIHSGSVAMYTAEEYGLSLV